MSSEYILPENMKLEKQKILKRKIGDYEIPLRPLGESYFVALFNCMYYMLLIPFRVDKEQVTGKYVMTGNKFQKVRIM